MRMNKIISQVRPDIKKALKEDCPQTDVTTNACVATSDRVEAEVIAKRKVVLSGLVIFGEVMRQADRRIRVRYLAGDGDAINARRVVIRLHGPGASILTAERTALNYLQRMCGIASLTAGYVQRVKGTKAKIFDTRKTTPNMRILEKYGVVCGGGHNHRMSLSDQPLIKENHIKAAGDIETAVRKLRRVTKKRIILEVTNPGEAIEGLNAGADILLLDNMPPALVKKIVKLIAGRAVIEVSGGVSLENVRKYALAGADRISVGAITHSAPAADLSLLLR
ncbi:MAG: nicotinate-nucleotide diphosphorylase (carboxylating) [bacterium]|nr:MAG: nicotinate-nucleotide diphosphorylase (carboxylating) [bacterium]